MADGTTTEPAVAPRPSRASTTRKARLKKLIRRQQEARLDILTTKLGWQAHAVRAAILRLKKSGCEIVLDRSGKSSVYRIARSDDGCRGNQKALPEACLTDLRDMVAADLRAPWSDRLGRPQPKPGDLHDFPQVQLHTVFRRALSATDWRTS